MGGVAFFLSALILVFASSPVDFESPEDIPLFEDRGVLVLPQEMHVPHSRRSLLNLLSNEVNQLHQKMKISGRDVGEDREIVDDVLSSLLRDPPLRTNEEISANKGRARPEVRIDSQKYENYRSSVEKSRNAVFKQLRDGKLVFLQGTRQAYDLDRILLLKEVFRKYYFQSKGAELLYDRILFEIKKTLWA